MKALKHRALARKYVGVRYQSPVTFAIPDLPPVKHTDRSASFEVDTRRHTLQEVVNKLSALGELEDITIEDEPLENIIADIFASRSQQSARGVTVGLSDAGQSAAAPAAGRGGRP
jgi:ABC-2 type transport system ATP-binding protein